MHSCLQTRPCLLTLLCACILVVVVCRWELREGCALFTFFRKEGVAHELDVEKKREGDISWAGGTVASPDLVLLAYSLVHNHSRPQTWCCSLAYSFSFPDQSMLTRLLVLAPGHAFSFLDLALLTRVMPIPRPSLTPSHPYIFLFPKLTRDSLFMENLVFKVACTQAHTFQHVSSLTCALFSHIVRTRVQGSLDAPMIVF